MSRRSNNNFRRKLKLILKAGQRCTTLQEREDYVTRELIALGYISDVSDLWLTLYHCGFNKVPGRVLARIGRAAIKQNKLVILSIIAWNYTEGRDISKITFTPEGLSNQIKETYKCPTQTTPVAATNK